MDAPGVPAFIRANTRTVSPPLTPEIRLHLATEITPIWQATETELRTRGLEPPFWAFCWPGGQVVARYLLDNPAVARGKSVLDFACGGAVSGIAAALAGAGRVVVNDIDGFALAAAQMNADLNGAQIEICADDLLQTAPPVPGTFDLVLAGDIFYERPVATEIERFLRACAAGGATVLIGDPGRKYLPQDGLEELARYPVPTTLELEKSEVLDSVVWRVRTG